MSSGKKIFHKKTLLCSLSIAVFCLTIHQNEALWMFYTPMQIIENYIKYSRYCIKKKAV